MATDNVTENLVKFAYGTKANYSAERHAQCVYFATDTPLIHTKGMWRGVSEVILDSSNMLHITTAEKDSDNNNTVATEVKVDLTAIACTQTQRNDWNAAATFVKSIIGTDQDNVINKWQEVVDFLAGIPETTLNAIMDTKADKATKVFGYNGIKITKTNAEGSVQEGDATLGSSFQVSIDNQMRGGTYTKVQVNDAGLVTVGQSLVESDLPAISIGKISGLKDALNDKVSISNEIYTAAPLSGGAPLNEDPTISLNYDNATLVLDSSTNKLKVGTISASQVTGLSNGYVPNTRQVIAGNGLTGGGALSADVTLSVKANGNTINVTSNGISVASAPKLSTARSLWGNSFDGTASISGDLTFVASGLTSEVSHGMRIGSIHGGFIGFSKIQGIAKPDGSITGGFTGISLGWGKDPETDAASVRINDSIFTYKGNPIYYQGSTDFTDGVRAVIAPELIDIANDFIAIGNRVTAVEKQLKWIEVS